jgi:hypothetical protein
VRCDVDRAFHDPKRRKSNGGQTDLGGDGTTVLDRDERLLRLGRPLVPESAGTARGLYALLLPGSNVLHADAAVLPDWGSTCACGYAGLAPTHLRIAQRLLSVRIVLGVQS